MQPDQNSKNPAAPGNVPQENLDIPSLDPIPNFSSQPGGLNNPAQSVPPTVPTAASSTPDPVITPANVTIESKKGGKGFGLFVIIGIISIILIYAGVIFIYQQNQKIKAGKTASGNNGGQTSQPSPTPSFQKEFVKISDGNVVYNDGSSEQKILVNKTDYQNSGIIGFIKVTVSPDDKKLCFESWPPAPKPAIYLSNTDGTNVEEIGLARKNCLFTNDSKYLLYMNSVSTQENANIYMFDIENKSESNLTRTQATIGKYNGFELVGLSADGGKAICKYEGAEEGKTGQCEINLQTKEIVFN